MFDDHSSLRSPGSHSREERCRQYCFADFTLDLESGFLRRVGKEVSLRPKSFEVLVYLVEHHGRLVAKRALMDVVWPDTAVTDNALARCLVEIRRALEDDSQQLIRTVARRGYVFTAEVTTPVVELRHLVPDASSERVSQPMSGPHAPANRPHWRSLISVSAVLVTMVMGLIAWKALSWVGDAELLRAVPLTNFPGADSGRWR